MKLNEDLFDSIDMPDVITDIELENNVDTEEATDVATSAVASMISTHIQDKYSCIDNVRSMITTLNDVELSNVFNEKRRDDTITVLTSILQDEQEILGKLQTLLNSIDPLSDRIDDGNVEVETMLAEREHPLDESLRGYKSYNDRLKDLPKDKINKIIKTDKNRKSCDWESNPEDLIYEIKYKDEIDAYNKRRYGFTW